MTSAPVFSNGFNTTSGDGYQAASGNVFVPELYTAQLLTDLEENLVLGSSLICNRNFEGEFRREGDVLHVPHFVDTVTDKGAVPAYAEIAGQADHASLEYMDVRVRKGSSFHIEVDNVHQWQTKDNINLFEDLVSQRARKTAIAIDSLIAKTIAFGIDGKDYNGVEAGKTPGTNTLHGKIKKFEGTAETGADDRLTDDVYDILVDMIQELDINQAPESRYLMISPKVRANLLRNPEFKDQSHWGAGAVMPSGQIGQILGIPVYTTTTLGNHSRSTQKFVKSAHTDASGIDMVLGSTNAVSLLVPHAEMKQYEPEAKFTTAVKSRVFYDAKIIRPEQLVVFSAKPKTPKGSS
ncbi:phage major capsid protein [Streptomyces noursei]|uniref:phage major capsid protein n=1 Tax=Streptomyces noursei TaxID=1971 RepID=UPI00344DB1AF